MELSEETITYGLATSGAVYDRAEASVPIEDLLAALEEAKKDGATHVVGLTGNHRGAKYVRIYSELEDLS